MVDVEHKEISEQDKKTFMTPTEFEMLLKHVEVVTDPYTVIQGNVIRLADTPIEKDGIPVKRYTISIRETDLESSAMCVLRNLDIVRRDLIAPNDIDLIEAQGMGDQLEAIEAFYREYTELVNKTPIAIFGSDLSFSVEQSPTTG